MIGISNPDPSPSTRFGAPGGPDPSVEGSKGGQTRGASILQQMHRMMTPEVSEVIAVAHIDRLKTATDIALFKEYTARQDGPITQSTDLRVTGDRTIVLGESDEVPPPLPEEE